MVAPQLPSQATPFVGRTEELNQIGHLLGDPTCRLFTLLGPGGIGKTRLALAAAVAQLERYRDGVHFVPLQALSSPDFIIPAIAEALRFQFHPGGEPKQQLFNYLCEMSLLLVLDNFEHLLDGVGYVTDLLAYAPDVRVLATSRERLNLVEEWALNVEGLPVPASESESDIGNYGAVQLFLQNAQRVHVGFKLTEAQKPGVTRICRLVSGMPLGIELASAWVRALSCEEIADELERGLEILKTPARNIEPRHRNIRAAFEPMWFRLSDEERAVFKKLSVFRGGFTRAAAREVAGATLPMLSALVDRSLVRMADNGRYDLHELLRQYAEERLRETADEFEDALERQCRYFAAFLAQMEKDLEGKRQKAAFEEIQRDLDNIRAAWRWAVERKREVEIAKACQPLWYFYDTRSWYREGEQAFRTAAEALGMYHADKDKSVVLGRIMTFYGGFCFSLNLADKARKLLEESLTILRRHQANSETSLALLRLSEVAIFLENDPLTAQSYLRESLMLCREVDYRWGAAYSLRWLGFVALYLEEYEEAQRLSEESLAIYEESGEPLGKVTALGVAVLSALGLGAFASAEQMSREILLLSKEIGLRWNQPNALILSGAAACGLKDYAEAAYYLYEGLRDACEIQFMPFVLFGLLETAAWLMATGSAVKALQILSFLLEYPVPPIKGKRAVSRLIAKLQDELSAEALAKALEQGKTSDLDTMVKDALAELSQPLPLPASHLSRDSLTERELEILHLIAYGLSNQDIADRLILSLGTVKWYTGQIYSKLGVQNRAQAAMHAQQMNLLS